MNIVAFAFRNIWRNRSRTVTTIGAMAFAAAIMIFYSALLDGLVQSMKRNVVDMSVGQIQIHARGYRDDPDLYRRIDNPDEILAALDTIGMKGTPRLFGVGLAAAGRESSGITMQGIDSAREKKVTLMSQHIEKGQWLDTASPHDVVVGKRLAGTLSVEPGDEIVILSQGADGSIANDLYRVRGVLKSIGSWIDTSGLLMTEGAFRELMVLPEGTHEIAIKAPEGMPLDEALQRVKPLVGDLVTESWRQIAPVIASVIDTTDAALYIMLLITYTAIGMVTLNAMLMSVFERIREFGVMKALGVTPGMIVALVYSEAIIQGVIAALLGGGVGSALIFHFADRGIDLTSLVGNGGATVAGVAMDTIWRPVFSGTAVVVPTVTLLIIVLVAVAYPGGKAAMIRPIEALHHD